MSRSGYSDDLDDQWQHIRWRGAVKAAIKGKKGQAFLKELEAALVALPEKKLLRGGFSQKGEVCAIGSVLVARKCATGMTREAALAEVEKKFPRPAEYEDVDIAPEAGIADALAREIMYVNDDDWGGDASAEQRYETVLKWVRSKIVSQ